jgi:hypothetical protein
VYERVESIPAKVIRKVGLEDLEFRRNIKGLKTGIYSTKEIHYSGIEKVELIARMASTIPADTELTNGARDYARTVSRSVMNCLERHFDGNQALFAEKWGVFSHSTFSTKCCSVSKPCKL